MANASEARTVPLISLGVREGLFFFRRFFLTFFFSFCVALLPSALFCLDAHAGSENQFAGYTSNAVPLYMEQGTCTLSSARISRSHNTMMRLTRHVVAPAVVGDLRFAGLRVTLVSCFFFPFRVISLPTILVLPSHTPPGNSCPPEITSVRYQALS